MRNLRFAIFGNTYQQKKSVWVEQMLRALEKQGATYCIDSSFCDYLTQEMQIDVHPAELIEGNEFEADYAVSMGGDGTFLQTAARVGEKGIPIVGVNIGRMGFLADVSGEEIEAAIQQLYNGDFRLEKRSVLQLKYAGGQVPDYPCALNEVAVLKRDSSSMISIRVEVNGEYLTTYQADGLIINTPTGSTGYALSVGGPIMSPEAETLGITPVAPHSLNVRPITLFDNAKIALTVESRSHNFLVALDGRSHTCNEGTQLLISKAPYPILVVKRHDSSFFSTLRNKLMWGTDIRVSTTI